MSLSQRWPVPGDSCAAQNEGSWFQLWFWACLACVNMVSTRQKANLEGDRWHCVPCYARAHAHTHTHIASAQRSGKCLFHLPLGCVQSCVVTSCLFFSQYEASAVQYEVLQFWLAICGSRKERAWDVTAPNSIPLAPKFWWNSSLIDLRRRRFSVVPVKWSMLQDTAPHFMLPAEVSFSS